MTVSKRTVRDFPCPKCGAQARELCKRLTPGRYPHIDGVHQARETEWRKATNTPLPAPEPCSTIVDTLERKLAGLLHTTMLHDLCVELTLAIEVDLEAVHLCVMHEDDIDGG